MYNLPQKFKKRSTRMGESMCQFKSSPKEIEYSSEGNFLFFWIFFVFTFFLNSFHA
jgi:hypothetical protein